MLSVSVRPASGRSPALLWWLRFTPNHRTRMVKHWRWQVGIFESHGWWKNSFTLDLVTVDFCDGVVSFWNDCFILSDVCTHAELRHQTTKQAKLPQIFRFNYQLMVGRLKTTCSDYMSWGLIVKIQQARLLIKAEALESNMHPDVSQGGNTNNKLGWKQQPTRLSIHDCKETKTKMKT